MVAILTPRSQQSLGPSAFPQRPRWSLEHTLSWGLPAWSAVAAGTPSWGPQHWEGLSHSVMRRNAIHGEAQVTVPAWPCPQRVQSSGPPPLTPPGGVGSPASNDVGCVGVSRVCPEPWHHGPVGAVRSCAAQATPRGVTWMRDTVRVRPPVLQVQSGRP